MTDTGLIGHTVERIKMVMNHLEPGPAFNFKPPISWNKVDATENNNTDGEVTSKCTAY